MDRKKLASDVINVFKKTYNGGDPLPQQVNAYIYNQIMKLNESIITRDDPYLVVSLAEIIAKKILATQTPARAAQEEVQPENAYTGNAYTGNPESIKDMMRSRIGKPDTVEDSLAATTKKSDTNVNINEIFGTSQPRRLQNIFNPQAAEKKVYLNLDNKYAYVPISSLATYRENRTISTFTWYINPAGMSSATNNTIGTLLPLKDVVKIRMLPFIIPNTEVDVFSTERVTVAIEELASVGKSAIDYNRRYHFLFGIEKITGTSGYVPLRLKDISDRPTEHEFIQPVKELTSITLSFAAPFRPLIMRNPISKPNAFISNLYNLTQTIIQFDDNPYISLGSFIYITGFTTTNPVADQYYIRMLNDSYGWRNVAWFLEDDLGFSPVDETKCAFINFDISGLTGTPILDKVIVLFSDRRFTIDMEVTMRRYDEEN